MSSDIIKISSKEKSTTIRLSETTKRMLESLAMGKETHEQILLRLMKLAIAMSTDYGSKVIEKQNMIGTKYERVHKTITIEIGQQRYSVVCVYNDLTLFSIFRFNKQLVNYTSHRELPKEWEVQLEIVNMKKDDGQWQQFPPMLLSEISRQDHTSHEYLLLYLISLKKILEETFDIKIYKIAKEEDYFDLSKWEESYKINNLSMESFDSDVERKIQGLA